ncbi:hypothetical protein AYO49_04440 [Verrucomicrobiaceae bacterium SCGC AG-212-N21]|nr:hypothetical protein AYO49_04440 [Verrucomicrobiaceae bacterium SCGC AG-212-N21]
MKTSSSSRDRSPPPRACWVAFALALTSVSAPAQTSTLEIVPASQRAEIGTTGFGWSTEWISEPLALAVTTEVLIPEAFQSRGLLHVWSLRTGKVLRSINTPSRVQVIAGDGRTPVVFVAGGAFNKNADDVNYVWMVDLSTGKTVRELPVWPDVLPKVLPQFRSSTPPEPYKPSIERGALSRDGTQFVLKTGPACAAYDLNNLGAPPRALPEDALDKIETPYAERLRGLPNWMEDGGARDGRFTLGAAKGSVSIWRNDTWEQVTPLGPAGTIVNQWMPSADGSALLALRLNLQGDHGTHLIWDLRSLEVIEWSEPRLAERCVPVLTRDGSILRFTRRTGPRSFQFVSRDWRAGQERVEGSITLQEPPPNSTQVGDDLEAAFSDDGMALAIGSSRGMTILRWTEPGLSKPTTVNGPVPAAGIGGLPCNGSGTYYMPPTTNDDFETRPARAWDAASGQTAELMAVKTLGHVPVYVLQSLPDVMGESFAYRVSGGSMGPYGFGLMTRLRNNERWQRQPDGKQPEDALWTFCGASFVHASDGNSVLVKFFDSSISTWDARNTRKLQEVRRNDLWPRRGMQRRATAPLIGRVFAALEGGGTQILDVQPDGGLKPIAQLWSPAPGSWLAVLPDGRYAVSPTAQPPVFFRQNGKLYPVEDFDARLNQPDAVAAALGSPAEVVADLRARREKRLERLGAEASGALASGPLLTLSVTPPLLHDSAHLTLTGEVRASAQAITHLELHVNDVPIFGRHGMELAVPANSSKTFTVQAPLAAGSNKVQIAAKDAVGVLSERETFLVHRSHASCQPARVVLAVGIADYNDTVLQDLTYAPKDATDIAAGMTQVRGQFTTHRTKVLADAQAKRADILAAKDFLKETKPEDEVIVFVSGHGVINEKGDYFFCAADFQSQGFQNGVSFGDLEGLFDGIPALNRLLLVDSCHSGELDDEQTAALRAKHASKLAAKGVVLRDVARKGAASPATEGQAVRRAASEVFLDLRRTTGATVLCASGGLEFAMEDSEQKNGLFTHALLKVMRQTASNLDTELPSSALVRSVAAIVQELTEGTQHPEARFTNLATDFPVIGRQHSRPPGRPEDVVRNYAIWSAGEDWSGFPRIGTCFAPDTLAFNKRTTPAAIQADEETYRAKFTRRNNRIENLSASSPSPDGSILFRYELVFDHSTLMTSAEAQRTLADVAAGKKKGWKQEYGGITGPDGRETHRWMNFSGRHQIEAQVQQVAHEWKITSLRVLSK